MFGAYGPHAQWRYADCVTPHLAQSPWTAAQGPRPYTVQYLESELAFVQRLLRQDGLVLRFERDTDTVVILVDSSAEAACPDLGAVRFHRDNPTECSETVPPCRLVKRAACSEYLTLLNLRNCQTLGGKVRTEQVYVHSKLLIVDDRIVILGSANINDRSLAGGRDSELAVCVTDLSSQTAPIDGRNPIHVRSFAHKLRKDLWTKHFALAGSNDVVAPASDLEKLLDKPADPKTWRAIQAVAASNAAAYASAFEFVPSKASSIWPVWKGGKLAYAKQMKLYDKRKLAHNTIDPYAKRMPFSKEFWRSKATTRKPTGIMGFICALPLEWTLKENNHPDMNLILLTQIDQRFNPSGAQFAQAPGSPVGMPGGAA